MSATRIVVGMSWLGMMVLSVGTVCGQGYPAKPIRMVTTLVGSGGDFSGRIIAEGISGPLKQPVIVDNRTSIIAPEVVAKAPPDGYTLLINGSGFWNTPFLQKTPYDPVKDFSPVTTTDTSYQILVVHPSVPAMSVKELIALAKSRPGQLNIGTGQSVTSGHLAMELFKSMSGINIVRVPYKGGSAALTGLLGGEVQMLFSNETTIFTQAKAGKLRVLAVASAQPTVLAPGLPTIADSGLPGFVFAQSTVVFTPANTPATIINRLNQEIVRLLNREDVKKRFFNAGLEVVANSPEELAAAMKSDMARIGKIIQEAGIKAE